MSPLAALPEGVISREDERQFRIPIGDAVAQRRFDLVKIWMNHMPPEQRAGFFDEEMIKRELVVLRRDERTGNARDLEACMRMLGIEVPASVEMPAEQDTSSRELDTRLRQITDEVVEFYTCRYIDGKLKQIQHRHDWRYRLASRHLQDVVRLEQAIGKQVHNLESWLKWYMLHAVNKELFYQDDGLIVARHDADVFCRTGRREDILDFFDAAQGAFASSTWDQDIGGMSWARIARAGYALWASKGGMDVLIDYIFDLEHNTGNIFDKSPTRVRQNATNLRRILELKREEELPDMFDAFEGLCSKETLTRSRAWLKTLKGIEQRVGT